jgi:hypothetical protein
MLIWALTFKEGNPGLIYPDGANISAILVVGFEEHGVRKIKAALGVDVPT